ncbi:hypothetical protein FE257_001508 [Aspergillus nanangensis]|uniref:Zn(2)-C6 fungal-type domain-containing protein n=1 Tax=Aspergillus nanangensis TaxID=2582783 RepID=A0AAD4GQN4_ASPNN|nr:hypothetical protein FE257_001508 [Aspergillus nanangensis]
MPINQKDMHANKGAPGTERRIRRAAAACYRCHWRKVRCDAAVLGYPCTNCTLDGITDCTLRPNATVRYKRLQRKDNSVSPPKTAPDACQTIPQHTATEYEWSSGAVDGLRSTKEPDIQEFDLGASTSQGNIYNVNAHSSVVEGGHTIFPGQYFLNLERLSSLPMSDVHLLMVNGCLEIPPKPALDVFLRKYFLLLHPLVPILNEAEFWGGYLQSSESPSYPPRVSLFVFQAMLLASCAFVPIETIHQCNFRDIHEARRVLYNRAKILYDTGFEKDALARAQGSLLLTFHTTAEDPQATMTWNICAIQNTVAMGIDGNHPSRDSMIIAKKRLWWSVFVRDRLLWLGRHRRPQFISANFHMPVGYLEEQELLDEIMSSPVHTPDAKRLLFRVFQAQCHLAIILTDVIAIAFSVSEGYYPTLSAEELHASLAQVGVLRSRLVKWKDDLQRSLHHTDISRQEAVETVTNLLWMHYQSARMALAHHETFLVEHNSAVIQDRSATILLTIAKELKDCVFHITQKMAYFASQNLAENIPLSVLASCGTPMVLSAIDVKLSSSYSEMLDRRRALDSCSEVIKQSSKVYDVTEFFSQGTNHILQLAYAITKNLFLNDGVTQPKKATHDRPSRANSGLRNGEITDQGVVDPPFSGLRINGWVEAFLKYPRAYLVLSTCIDHSLATGRLPKDEFLPPLVRGMISAVLGLPKLPWTIATPANSSDIIPSDHAIEDRRRFHGRNKETLVFPNECDPSVDNNNIYWTLMHNVKNRSQSMGREHSEREFSGSDSYHNDAPITDEQLNLRYLNPNLELNCHRFDPLSG